MVFKSLLLVCVGALLSGGALSAGILYNQPFDGTYNAYASQNDSNTYGLFAEVYDNFELAGTTNINEVQWTGLYFDPATQGPITSWEVAFFANNAGQPGASALYTATISGTGGETFLGSYNGYPTYTYDVTLTTPFAASGGTTYWLSVVPTLGFPPQWGWSTGTGGDGNSYQDFNGSRTQLSADMAFTLSSSSIPEPVSMSLVGTGLMLLGFAARRRRA